jgi:hypothetical protein
MPAEKYPLDATESRQIRPFSGKRLDFPARRAMGNSAPAASQNRAPASARARFRVSDDSPCLDTPSAVTSLSAPAVACGQNRWIDPGKLERGVSPRRGVYGSDRERTNASGFFSRIPIAFAISVRSDGPLLVALLPSAHESAPVDADSILE